MHKKDNNGRNGERYGANGGIEEDMIMRGVFTGSSPRSVAEGHTPP